MRSGTTSGLKAQEKILHVVQGEHKISSDPNLVMVTLLGSCVAACLRDPIAGIGGMNHFLLPGREEGQIGGEEERHAVHAMELLVNALLAKGASRRRLEAKIFGGRVHHVRRRRRRIEERGLRDGLPRTRGHPDRQRMPRRSVRTTRPVLARGRSRATQLHALRDLQHRNDGAARRGVPQGRPARALLMNATQRSPLPNEQAEYDAPLSVGLMLSRVAAELTGASDDLKLVQDTMDELADGALSSAGMVCLQSLDLVEQTIRALARSSGPSPGWACTPRICERMTFSRRASSPRSSTGSRGSSATRTRPSICSDLSSMVPPSRSRSPEGPGRSFAGALYGLDRGDVPRSRAP